MHVPVYLEIAQWALLLGLGLLLVVLYRQLGRLLSEKHDHAELGPPVGSKAAPIRYATVPDGGQERLAPGDGRPALIAFVDPTCPACEQLVVSLGELQSAGELAGRQVLLLISDPPGYLAISAAFRTTSLPIGRPLSAAEVAGYRATGTPLLVAVDGGGIVQAAGVASRLPDVRSYAEAAASDGIANEREVAR